MKISKDEACKIAERFVLQSYKGSLTLSGARLVEAPTGSWRTPHGQTNGEWKVIFRKVPDGDSIFEPNIVVIFVDAITGETAKFPMI